MTGIRFKKRLAIAVAALIGVACFGESVLMEYVPGKARYVVSIDVKALSEHSMLASCRDELTKSGDVDAKNVDRAKADLDKIRTIMLVSCGAHKGVALIEADTDMKGIEASLVAWGVKFERGDVSGKPALLITLESSMPELNRTIAVMELKPTVYMATEKEYAQAMLKAVLAKDKKLRVVAPAGAPELWGYADMYYIANGVGGKDKTYGQYIRSIKSIAGQLKLTGEKRDTLSFTAKIACVDAKAATQIHGMLMPIVMMGANLAFAEDPALGAEFTNRFKGACDGANLDLKFTVDPAFGAKLIEFAKKKTTEPDNKAVETAAPVATPVKK